ARLLVKDRLHPRSVTAGAPHLVRVLQLTGGAPESEVEGLLLQRLQLLAQLVRRLVPQIRSFHPPDPFRPQSRISRRASLQMSEARAIRAQALFVTNLHGRRSGS